MALKGTTKLALVGLHGSGKTSYIAALWTVLQDGDVPGSLSLATVPDNSEYLSKISADWLRCNEPEHTPTEGLQTVELELQNEAGATLAMSAPDLSGETYRDLFVSRNIAPHLSELLEDVSGLLVVVHPDYEEEGVPIDDMAAALDTIILDYDGQEGGEDQSAEGQVANGNEVEEFDDEDPEQAIAKRFRRKLVISQVKVVDVLQAIFFHLDSTPRIVVLVSAWDVLEDLKKTPRQWLDGALPLLSQYLDGLADVALFGLSAQGGTFDGDSAQKIRKINPVDRPRVVTEDGEVSNDLTLPLRHLLETSS